MGAQFVKCGYHLQSWTGGLHLIMSDLGAYGYFEELGAARRFAAGEIVLARGGCDLCHVIKSGLVSVRFGMSAIEVDLLSAGELVNIGALLETDENEHFAVAVTPCETFAVATETSKQIAAANPDLRLKLLKYLQRRIVQSMRAAECHLAHSTEKRLACWIAIATELVGGPKVTITHNELSTMLGVRRPTVTLALQQLEGYRAIWSRRNRIVVRERAKLLDHACNCLAARSAVAAEATGRPLLP